MPLFCFSDRDNGLSHPMNEPFFSNDSPDHDHHCRGTARDDGSAGRSRSLPDVKLLSHPVISRSASHPSISF